MMKIKITELRGLCKRALEKGGFPGSEAEVIADMLLYAELTGKSSQGVNKIPAGQVLRDKNEVGMKIVKESPSHALIDGGRKNGIVVLQEVVRLAIAKGRQGAIAIVGAHNSWTTTGVLGYYARAMAKEGLIGIVACCPPPSVAPHGSIDAILGTNPLAVGIPTKAEPMVLDMSTARTPFLALLLAKALGQAIPAGIAIDKAGNETTDPAAAIEGAILPFGGHKGSGVALAIEVLAGGLVGAHMGSSAPGSWGSIAIAINPAAFIDAAQFKENVSKLAAEIKNSRKAAGFSEILVPGEKSERVRQSYLSQGYIEIDDKILSGIKKAAA